MRPIGVLYALIFCLPLSGWAHDSAWKRKQRRIRCIFTGLVPWPRIGWLTGHRPRRQGLLA